MRIVGGTHRGRTLAAPPGLAVRPTSDRVRESLFNILAHHPLPNWSLDGARVLDAFAGTGALGLEALSRGAGHTTFFDNAPQAFKILQENVQKLGFTECAECIRTSALTPPVAAQPAQLVFFDPPYHKNLIPSALPALMQKGWITPGAVIVAECAVNEKVEWPETVSLILTRRYGQTQIHLLRI